MDVCHGGWGNEVVSILADVGLVSPLVNNFCFEMLNYRYVNL